MNPNAKNLPEFKKLIERYETITIEEIEAAKGNLPHHYGQYQNGGSRVQKLTGFGSFNTCKLCRRVKSNCYDCFYDGDTACTRHITYRRIATADTPRKLLYAYRARAKYMRTLIEK